MVNRRTLLSALVATGCNGWVLTASAGGLFSDKEALRALRTALSRGAQSAVSQLGRTDGFLKNDQLKIRLPSAMNKVTPMLRMLGKSAELDEMIVGMNRAAEQATPLALPLLKSAIEKMNVNDARKILSGGDTSVTDFFASKTRDTLQERFLPIVERTTNKLALTQPYSELAGLAESMGVLKPEQASVGLYVTDQALSGLFTMIGAQERAIRNDPVGTGSAILKKVFGAL